MATDRDLRGPAAGADRTAQPAENVPPRRRTGPIHWFLFNSACVAASVALMWFAPVIPLPAFLRGPAFATSALAIPLALILVPGVLLRHVTHRKPPKPAIVAITVVLPAAIVLAVVTREAGEERGLEKRGRWTEAVVVDVDNGNTDKCTLRTRDGREISPRMTDGCDPDTVEPGDTLRVLYDPKGAAGPLEGEDTEVDLDPGAYKGVIGGLAALIVVTGTWGWARVSRGER
ncbi:hypothetical protein QF034_000230 [Streptomyces africanus]|uniref:DUF3592 domain-containing protein n=1 Tax=Streptomyces africanus TaxID=231024 RepID=A0ABU0QF49_9ACTN|nr:hypothetical protein [Streptomyces africanus]MDQ0745999.1 hypothetical protein [Streptomyces africanus]